VVPLDAQKGAHAREQLVVIERLLDEVVGSRLDRPRLVLSDARGDHDHRQHRRLLVRAQALAHRIAVEPGHEDVEQHQIRLLGFHDRECFGAVARGDDVVPLRREHRLEQAHVLGDVVDDEDLARCLRAHPEPPSQKRRTVSISSSTSTGLER
jgi:hypothetical protein